MPAQKPRAPIKQYVLKAPMERIAMDFIGPLPETDKGNKYILVVDYFTKWVEAFPLPNQEAVTVAKVLVEQFFCRFVMPRQLHTDQGRNCESNLLKEVCQLLGIEKTQTTPYNPRSDGLVERFNRTLLDTVAKYLSPDSNQRDWDEQVPFALMAYRSSIQESTGETPNMMMIGREVELPIDLQLHKTDDEEPGDYARMLRDRMRDAWDRARENLRGSQAVQKRQYNMKQCGHEFKPGYLVWYRKNTKKKGLSPKLQVKWIGPYQVQSKLSDVTYRISKGRTSKSLVVQFDNLKRCDKRQIQGNVTGQSVMTYS